MTYAMEISNASQQSEWCDQSDGTKFIKLQRCLWSYQWSEPRQPRQDERGGPWGGGHAGTAGHRGHDGAPHLQGRDITQVGTRTDIVKWSSLTFHESYRDIDSVCIWNIEVFEVLRVSPGILVMCGGKASLPAVTPWVRLESGDFSINVNPKAER